MPQANRNYLTELISEGARFRVHRLLNTQYGASVVSKTTRTTQPSPQDLSLLENERQILQTLAEVDGVPKLIAFNVESHSSALILSDFAGTSISEILRAGPFVVEDFLSVAIHVVEILSKIHSCDVVHGELSPHSILLDLKTNQVQISEFGNAKRLVGRGQFQTSLSGASLAYIAPEQTGRVNRRVDHRTDFYILGVTFYQMITGQLPFTGHDALEWVHAHIAKRAPSLLTINSEIPPSLAKAIEKLMSKAAEERYQSAEGLLYDLRRVQANLKEGLRKENFELGSADHSSRFMLTQKLVGRKSELDSLERAWRDCRLQPRQVLLSGASGMGKSTLVREFARVRVAEEGIFSSGKFDSRQTNVPLSGITQVFTGLIDQIKTWPEDRLRRFTERLEVELGDGIDILLPVIPSLAQIVRTHSMEAVPLRVVESATSNAELFSSKEFDAHDTLRPKLRGLDRAPRAEHPDEARLWQKSSLDTLLKVIQEFVSPLILFLDDIQYMDEGSSRLLIKDLEFKKMKGVLLVAAFRADEGDASPYFKNFLEASLQSPLSETLSLGQLTVDHVSEFVGETLNLEKSLVADLSEAIHLKSGGNPFFMNQIFKSLADDGLLNLRPGSGWTWDLERISAREIPNNVVDLLSVKIRTLSKEVRDALKAASCFSKSFALSDLSGLNDVSDAKNREYLLVGCEAGMIFPESEIRFKFVHERIREMVYKLLRPEQRREIHAKLGIGLLTQLHAEGKSETHREELYDAVSHATIGIEFIKDQDQRAMIGRFSLLAARMARESAAFDMALTHANGGIRAYGQAAWTHDFEKLFQLYLLKGEMEYLTNQISLSDQSFDLLDRKMTQEFDRVRLSIVRMGLLIGRGRHREAISKGLEALARLGVRLPENPSILRILRDEFMLRTRMRVSGIPDLSMVRTEADELTSLLRAVLILMGQASYFVNKRLFVVVGIYGCLRTYRMGLDRNGAVDFFFFGLYMARTYGQYVRALELTEAVLSLPADSIPRRARQLISFSRAAFLGPVTMAWDESNFLLAELFTESRQQGDFSSAGYASLYLAYYLIYSGNSLVDVGSQIQEKIDYLKEIENSGLYASVGGARSFVSALTDSDSEVLDAPDSSSTLLHFEEGSRSQELKDESGLNPRAWFVVHKFISHVLFNETLLAAKIVDEAREAYEVIPFSLSTTILDLFQCIWITDMARLEKRSLNRKDQKALKKSKKRISGWLVTNPRNYAPILALIEAEESALNGDLVESMKLFEQATKIASQGTSWLMKAVAFERAARFYQRAEKVRISELYAKDALYAYQRWGAARKVIELRIEFVELRTSILESGAAELSQQNILLPDQLDMKSASKAAQALSSELDTTELLRKLMQIMIENAGAERGVVLLKSGDAFEPVQLQDKESTAYPLSLIQAVLETEESLVLDDDFKKLACQNDNYILSRSTLSALCMPLKEKGQVRGLLYLEHASSLDVFTTDRLEMLKIILGQASISLENARLYSEIGDKARMESELKMARAVQETLFPAETFEAPRYSVAGHYEPATECGGDWWYFHEVGNKLFVYIGDATGHGVPAALVTSAARAAVSLFSEVMDITPARAMNLLNRAIFETSKGSMNMTFLICSIDLHTGDLTYCNASHDQPVLIRQSMMDQIRDRVGQTDARSALKQFREELDLMNEVNGPRLGERLNVVYREATIQTGVGDVLIMATDGLCDVKNRSGDTWGQRNFTNTLFQTLLTPTDAVSIVHQLRRATTQFRAGEPLLDDVTFAVIQLK